MKTKVILLSFGKLPNGLHLGFHTESQECIITCGAKNIACIDECILYAASILAEVDVVQRQQGSVLTGELDAKDKERNELVAYIFGVFDSSEHSPVAAAKDAHKHLKPVLKPYRGMGNHAHSRKNAEIIGMLHDLRMANLAAYITTLNISSSMDLLETKNSEYIKLDEQRLAEKPSKADTEVLRKNVDKAYLNIIDKVNGTVVLAPNEAAITLVEKLNNLIHQTNTAYNLHMAHFKKEDEAPVKKGAPSEGQTAT